MEKQRVGTATPPGSSVPMGSYHPAASKTYQEMSAGRGVGDRPSDDEVAPAALPSGPGTDRPLTPTP